MSSNFGEKVKITIFGQSHSEAIGVVIDGLPVGEAIDMEQVQQLENQLNQNADQIARMLANTNAKYDYEELRRMLRMHLDLMKNSMTAELNGNHNEAVRLIDENEEQLMQLADVLTEGLMEQFYQR